MYVEKLVPLKSTQKYPIFFITGAAQSATVISPFPLTLAPLLTMRKELTQHAWRSRRLGFLLSLPRLYSVPNKPTTTQSFPMASRWLNIDKLQPEFYTILFHHCSRSEAVASSKSSYTCEHSHLFIPSELCLHLSFVHWDWQKKVARQRHPLWPYLQPVLGLPNIATIQHHPHNAQQYPRRHLSPLPDRPRDPNHPLSRRSLRLGHRRCGSFTRPRHRRYRARRSAIRR